MKFTNIMCMPTSMSIFATTATHLLKTVTDLKHMARYSDYLLNGNLGLKKLAKLLQNHIGTQWHRLKKNWRSCSRLIVLLLRSDSLLTASVYADEGNFQGLTKDIRRLFIWITISHSTLLTTSYNRISYKLS